MCRCGSPTSRRDPLRRLGEDLAEARRDLAAARCANEAQARQLQDATSAIATLHTAVCGNGQLPSLT